LDIPLSGHPSADPKGAMRSVLRYIREAHDGRSVLAFGGDRRLPACRSDRVMYGSGLRVVVTKSKASWTPS